MLITGGEVVQPPCVSFPMLAAILRGKNCAGRIARGFRLTRIHYTRLPSTPTWTPNTFHPPSLGSEADKPSSLPYQRRSGSKRCFKPHVAESSAKCRPFTIMQQKSVLLAKWPEGGKGGTQIRLEVCNLSGGTCSSVGPNSSSLLNLQPSTLKRKTTFFYRLGCVM